MVVPELKRLLQPDCHLLGYVAAPLGDKVAALENPATSPPELGGLLGGVIVDLVHALHALAERSNAAGAVSMPAEEAARVRATARNAHALGSATLPLVGDALRDVRALETRLVQLQRRNVEVLEDIGRGLPGAAAPSP